MSNGQKPSCIREGLVLILTGAYGKGRSQQGNACNVGSAVRAGAGVALRTSADNQCAPRLPAVGLLLLLGNAPRRQHQLHIRGLQLAGNIIAQQDLNSWQSSEVPGNCQQCISTSNVRGTK